MASAKKDRYIIVDDQGCELDTPSSETEVKALEAAKAYVEPGEKVYLCKAVYILELATPPVKTTKL